MPNAWIDFVKKWSKEHNMSYFNATSNPECKKAYHSGKVIEGGGSYQYSEAAERKREYLSQ